MPVVVQLLLVLVLTLPPKHYSGGPYKDWWPLSNEKKRIVEQTAESLKATGECAPGTHLAWPPVAVEIKLRPAYGDDVHVGGKTDYRELGCWRQYHITLSDTDSVAYTLVFATNRDSTCVRMDSTKTDFRLDRVEPGTSKLARKARDITKTLDCIPKEPLVLIRFYGRPYYTYLDCHGSLITLSP